MLGNRYYARILLLSQVCRHYRRGSLELLDAFFALQGPSNSSVLVQFSSKTHPLNNNTGQIRALYQKLRVVAYHFLQLLKILILFSKLLFFFFILSYKQKAWVVRHRFVVPFLLLIYFKLSLGYQLILVKKETKDNTALFGNIVHVVHQKILRL